MKFIQYLIPSTVGIAALLFLFSCGAEESVEVSVGANEVVKETYKAGEIHLSETQAKTIDIAFGDFSMIKANDFIAATGSLGLPPNAYSTVSAKAKGFIKNSKKYLEGSYVKKGAIIATLENPEFIQLQQKYLEVSAALTYLQAELKRQQDLVVANAGVLKNLQKLESDVAMKTAQLGGQAKQLAYLGIDVAKLTPQNILGSIYIIAPMSGFITSINVHNGMYVSPEMELMEIVNEDHLHLELDVFEQDIANIKEGQKISYTVPALGNTVYEGEVHTIGKEFNRDSKTVRIHGHLEKEQPRFIKDLFIKAKIWLNDQTVSALPEASIIRDEGKACIYVSTGESQNGEYVFEAITVIPGVTNNGYTTVKLIDELPEGIQIVTNGAYYVYAQSKKGKAGHDH